MSACFLIFLSLVLSGGGLDDLPVLSGGIKRISSYDLKEGNNDYYQLFPGQTLVLADIKGGGTIKRLFIKVYSDDPTHLRSMVLRFLWDDSDYPAVHCPLGDFFALGHARYYDVNSAPIVTGNKRGLTCYFPMPFRKRALMLLNNEGTGLVNRIYYQIDYEPGPPAGGVGLFHALYNQGVVVRGGPNYQVLYTEGKGKYVGVVLSMVLGEDGWFGHGDERIYIGGKKVPAVQGTGLDDLFGSAWGFQNGFSSQYFGTPLAGDLMRGSEFSCYKFNIRDPICFSGSLEVVLEHVGENFKDGWMVGDSLSRSDEYYSVAYWYQTETKPPFCAMPHAADRISGDRRFTIEGEKMPPLPGTLEKIDELNVYGETVIRYKPEKIGCVAEFRVTVPENCTYEVSGFFTRSRRHGIYRLKIGEDTVGESVDFFRDEGGVGRFNLQRSDEIFFGRIGLKGGEHLVRFEALGTNEYTKEMMLDIDCMLFRPLP